MAGVTVHFNTNLHYFADVESCPDGHWIVEASPETEAQHGCEVQTTLSSKWLEPPFQRRGDRYQNPSLSLLRFNRLEESNESVSTTTNL